MNNLKGKFHWGWNCGSANDIDVQYYWGDNGTLTIQRHYLRKIIYSWRFCNSRDGWIEETKTFLLPQPTSEPYTFPVNIAFGYTLGKNLEEGADEYWGRKYKVEAKLYIFYGKEAISDEEYSNVVTGCFKQGDSNFNTDMQPCCNPPDVQCETGATYCD